ncbi:hypothetical protein RclHR1_00220006 [Rhizophagus clarus]|uniref:Mso1 N-terminal domain-containing protein n=1 Tax=Rhizophagus clarus TaxID=94130 RepID=A0A2Z6QYB5_9GLOM|nr:hypothetical protein RclHR1_00220006 [Rhizophagus clarus]GES75544.1 hypothetical protein GLOIN_2v1623837 [Rhizophagus clarus]
MVDVIDYRISRIVVLCKDCGQDVGLYPARHKCGIPTSEGLPIITKDSSSNNSKLNSSSSNSTETYNLWNKFMTSATAIYNVDDDSDNESEKDDWDGETHVSRILREYYEDKGADLPDWLYDSDTKHNSEFTKNSYIPQIEHTSTKQTRNVYNNPTPFSEVNNDRGRQIKSRPYNNSTRDIPPGQNHTLTKMNRGRDKSAPPPGSFDRNRDISPVQYHTSIKMNRGRDKSAPPPSSFDRNNIRNHENVYPHPPPLPKNIDSRRIIDDRIKNQSSNYSNSLPSRRQPPPTSGDYNAAKRLIPSKKSYNQLNLNYNNTLNKVSPNHDIRTGGYYNNNVQKGNIKQGVTSTPISSSHVPRVPHVPRGNYVQGNYF